jgi:PilZ domain-containing protein
MTQAAELEFPQVVARELSFGECPPSPPVSGTLTGASRSIGRSEARDRLSTSLWVTSLQRPGVFEVVHTENISRSGMQIVTQEFWKPDEPVLVSSPPGFCVQGSVVYCKKLPSDDYFVGISLEAPVEDSAEALGFGES